jgi:hypothetical protein
LVSHGPAVARNAQELLSEFVETGRQEPFEEIVRRYAGMVFNVCLGILKDTHDAEDATQAVFLTLAVQAKTADLTEALRQQTATGEVLKVIASSPTNVGPALQAIVESACAFCDAYDAGVVLKIGDDLHFSAHHGPIPTGQQPRPVSRQWVTGRSVVDKVPVQVSDFQGPEAAEFPEGQRQAREQGADGPAFRILVGSARISPASPRI